MKLRYGLNNTEEYTQKDCVRLCLEHNCYSPVYSSRSRDGCALCFNAKADERKRWFLDYPEAFNILLHLQDVVRAEKPDLIILSIGSSLYLDKGYK